MTEEQRIAAEVNRRYWESESSVSDIAEELGVSRRALYSALQPEPAGASCTDCGGELVFVNRSARTGGIAQCSVCAAEQAVDTNSEVGTAEGTGLFGRVDALQLGSLLDGRGRAIATGAFAGLLTGAAVAWILARRR